VGRGLAGLGSCLRKSFVVLITGPQARCWVSFWSAGEKKGTCVRDGGGGGGSRGSESGMCSA
jgi:hypothetical protein